MSWRSFRQRLPLPRQRFPHWFVGSLLSIVWFWFAGSHLVHWHQTGDVKGLGAMAVETVVAVLFVLRRQAFAVTGRRTAWIAAVAGTFAPMLFRPTTTAVEGLEMVAVAVQLTGAVLAITGLLALARSFGIVPANRGVQTRGPYAFVRHPIYAAYLVLSVGYVLENPSAANAVVFVVATLAQVVRIRYEESVLAEDATYAAYRRRVTYRLIPYVY